MKTCTKCKETKPLTEFQKRNDCLDGVRKVCKECLSVTLKSYRNKNAKRISVVKKAWRKANPEKEAGYAKTNFHNNPERHYAKNAKRRALKKDQTPELTVKEQGKVLDIYTACKALNEFGAGIHKWHVDHIVALANGGLHHPNNLQILTAEENLRKGAK